MEFLPEWVVVMYDYFARIYRGITVLIYARLKHDKLLKLLVLTIVLDTRITVILLYQWST